MDLTAVERRYLKYEVMSTDAMLNVKQWTPFTCRIKIRCSHQKSIFVQRKSVFSTNLLKINAILCIEVEFCSAIGISLK